MNWWFELICDWTRFYLEKIDQYWCVHYWKSVDILPRKYKESVRNPDNEFVYCYCTKCGKKDYIKVFEIHEATHREKEKK